MNKSSLRPPSAPAGAKTCRAPKLGVAPGSAGSWGVYENAGQRRLTHVCHLSENFASTSFGTFDLRTGSWVVDPSVKMIFMGTRQEAESLLLNTVVSNTGANTKT